MDYSKGQSASEYLALLAAVLMVVLAAVTLLQYFPVMGGEAGITESHLYWAGNAKPISVLDATTLGGPICGPYLSNHSGFRMVVKNLNPDPVYITAMKIGGNAETFCASGANESETSLSMGPGQKATIDVQGPPCQPSKLAELELAFVYDTPYSQGNEEIGAKKFSFRCPPATIATQPRPCLAGNCSACVGQPQCETAGCTWNATSCI